MSTHRMATAATIALVFAAHLFAADPENPVATASLYQRLGGDTAIRAVASDLVDRILADKRINGWFAHAAGSPENTAAYKAKLSDFLCESTGGPCHYGGHDMVAAHKGRGVTSAAFDAVAQDLTATLDKFEVLAHEKQEVLDLAGSLKASIVQKTKSTE